MNLRPTDIFAALDFEIARSNLDSICQIGIAVVDQASRKIQAWGALVRPEPNEFGVWQTRTHGIRAHHVKDSPSFEQAWPELRKRLEPCAMLAAHGNNDRLMLERSLANIGEQRPMLPWIDTVKLARKLWPGHGAKLGECAERLGLELKAHDAKSDAILCARIVLFAIAQGVEIEADIPPRATQIELTSAPKPDPLPPMRDPIRAAIEADISPELENEFPVWSTKYARSGEPAPGTYPLSTILTTRFSSDAHFAAYTHPSGRRLSRASLREIDTRPTMRALVVDVDGSDSERYPIGLWKARAIEHCAKLPGSPFGYLTRSGLRLVWQIEPFLIWDEASAVGWSAEYAIALAKISIVTGRGLVSDIACKDWQRMYRVPKCIRDGEWQDHGLACGNPSKIGFWPQMTPAEGVRDELSRLAGASTLWAAAYRQVYPEVSPERRALPRASNSRGPVDFAVRTVAAAQNGTRNRTLFVQARWLYELSRKGELEWCVAADELAGAAISAGLEQREVEKTMASAER